MTLKSSSLHKDKAVHHRENEKSPTSHASKQQPLCLGVSVVKKNSAASAKPKVKAVHHRENYRSLIQSSC